jgi:hypothetical protein
MNHVPRDMNPRASQQTPRTIRVIAIPGGMGGYWAEAALEERETAL